jgi:hypothetical protein
MTERSMTIRERALATIGALAGFGPLTRIGGRMDTRPLTRASDLDTSHEAATRIATTMSDTQKLVLDFIRSRGASGCTDLDIQRRFGNHGSTYRTRRAELTALGLVRDSGVRVTQDKRRRIVWVLAEHA